MVKVEDSNLSKFKEIFNTQTYHLTSHWFIAGMWKKEEAFIMLLNIDDVFTEDDLLIVQDVKENQQSEHEASVDNDTLTK